MGALLEGIYPVRAALCSDCLSLKRLYIPGETAADDEPQAEFEEEIEMEGDGEAPEDDCVSDISDNESDDEEEEEEEEFGPGSIVWVRFRSWFPAEVLGFDQLGVKDQAVLLSPDTVYVRRFGTGDTRVAKTKFLSPLGENAVDAARASKGSSTMMDAYQMALARLRGEDQCF